MFGNPVFCLACFFTLKPLHKEKKKHTDEYSEATVEFAFHWITRRGEQQKHHSVSVLLQGYCKWHYASSTHSSQQMGKEAPDLRVKCCVCVT